MTQTVLLIDGDASRADALKIFLARKHVEVKTAVTAERAGRLMTGHGAHGASGAGGGLRRIL